MCEILTNEIQEQGWQSLIQSVASPCKRNLLVFSLGESHLTPCPPLELLMPQKVQIAFQTDEQGS